jgi:predicted adenylyl cyclase CyaB
MNEVEVKGLVADLDATRARVRRAGAALVYAGRLTDRRYDTPARSLAGANHVLRVRSYGDGAAARATIDWKGPVTRTGGYKEREELSAGVLDPAALTAILDRLGYVLTREIDREIEQYTLDETTLRFECYPRMDVLLEVEGEPAGIERAIAATGLARAAFGTDRLPEFARRYEQRTGQRAALSQRELAGDYRFRMDDA